MFCFIKSYYRTFFLFTKSCIFLFFLAYHLKCFGLTPCITKRNHVWKYHLTFFFCNFIIFFLFRRCSTKGAVYERSRTSYVTGYHVYKNCWIPVKGEMLKAVTKPKNKEDKFAVVVMKDDYLVGHLSKENPGWFAKIIFYLLRACDTNTQGDGKGMKVPCKLYFSDTVVL